MTVDLLSATELKNLDPRASRRCQECGGPIVGRPRTATTCLVHRHFGGTPSREELVRLIAEHEAVVEQLRAALTAMDGEANR